ncbi:hypothetical protein [Sphingobacterium pedocola]|uniref:Uncharacterized protein n=1 Tax=Sphingobacterium pedocola TaxID=2082722 RepID=A0ABR9TCH8_9SPHI|nr:hypothetical protein [Sphingobacterium pedocola]MBE8723061.1 hypothetical protein [Sphingobacterium pedocola]
MKFVKVTRQILCSLQEKGFNILASTNTLHEIPGTYIPKKVDDVWLFLEHWDFSGTILGSEGNELLVIEEALLTKQEKDLKGMVWIEDEDLFY